MPKKHRRLAFASAVALSAAALVLSGCSSSSNGLVSTALDTVPQPQENPDEFFVFATADLDALREASGLGDDEDWYMQLAIGSDHDKNPLPLSAVFPPEWVYAMVSPAPWRPQDVNEFAFMSAPPESIAILRGNDKVAIPDDFIEWTDGMSTDYDTPDFELDMTKAGEGFDNLGRATRMLKKDGALATSTSTALVSAWAKHETPLSEVAGVAAVGAAFDAQDALSAAIVPFFGSGDGSYDYAGIAWAGTRDEPRWLAAYHFSSAEQAAAAADKAKAAWGEGFMPFDKIEANATDEVVTVIVTPGADLPGTALISVLMQQDSAVFSGAFN